MLLSRADFARRLLRWYDRNRRSLPWRGQVTPYAILISEFMLQQTQVATVIPYYNRFLARFPTVTDLAGAQEQEVLRLWQGLGYYSRARNLQKAAREIVSTHGGQVPADAEKLLSLPGIGRYTAGAVASIAFGLRRPILDGNVARVLCRLDRVEDDPRNPSTRQNLWRRAEEILPTRRVGDFNSALMELGATVCTPKSPACLLCPVRQACAAFAAGVQETIPPSRKSRPTPLHRRWTFLVEHKNRFLIEQRPAPGRWAGLWQFPTIEARNGSPKPPDAAGALGFRVGDLHHLADISHALTHRRYSFSAFTCAAIGPVARPSSTRRWVTLAQLDAFPLSRPQLRLAQLISGKSPTN